MNKIEVREKLKVLREERGLSLREVARLSGVSPATLSHIENGHSSPTLDTLRKILEVLGSSFGEFFEDQNKPMEEPVFSAEDMKSIQDAHRRYTFLFPKIGRIRVQLVLEEIKQEDNPNMETHRFDVAGYLLEGGPLELEIESEGKWKINQGDAFYVPSGHKHRAVNKGSKTAKLLTCYYPPMY